MILVSQLKDLKVEGGYPSPDNSEGMDGGDPEVSTALPLPPP